MALCGVAFVPPLDGRQPSWSSRCGDRGGLPLRLRRPQGSRATNGGRRAGCSLRRTAGAGSSRTGAEKVTEEEDVVGPVTRFEVSDFAVADRVSVGLHGRSDEVIYEATVCDPKSPLYNSRVVLRQLTSRNAKRRGRRALEVLKKLARRQNMYHSYSMQVHGYISASDGVEDFPFTLVHGYHGSYSLWHWLQLSDWFPTLEATWALDEESVRRVGDDSTGGPTVTRKLRLTRILMRDLLIGVNYLHSHGLAHTELRLENVHISPVDKHVKVGILGNAVDFHDNNIKRNVERRKLMIAYDMRCVGFIMAKVIMKELMDASIFRKLKSFLTKGNDPTCLREFLLPILCRDSPSGNVGLQMLDRNWGAGWNLLSLLLATKPSERISSLDALRHPFLCGPRWRIQPSMSLIRWGLGSTVVRLAEDYIYDRSQRNRMAYFIELMELLNPSHKLEDWRQFLSGRWRLLYSTGRHIGLTFRQPASRVLICNAYLNITQDPDFENTFTLASDITYKVITSSTWPHDKSGSPGSLNIRSVVKLGPGRRFYPKEDDDAESLRYRLSANRRLGAKKWKQMGEVKELPSSLPAVKFVTDEIEVSMSLDDSSSIDIAKQVVQEVRTQIPPEMFDVSRFICGTYVDSRMMVLRGVSGSALLFTRSCTVENCT